MKLLKIIYVTILSSIMMSCASESNTNNNPNVVCDCPLGNVQANSNDLIGDWKLNKRTILDATGTTVTEVQDLSALAPCYPDSFHLEVTLDANNNKVMSVPVGGLTTPALQNCGNILNIEFPVVYYEDGGSCLKLLSTSPNAGHKLCLLDFTSTTLKIKMYFSQKYYIFECTKI
jgi:hypothetical protein